MSSFRCPVCGEIKDNRVFGANICIECNSKQIKQEIYDKASRTESCSDFKEWSERDRATAFCEAFGRYVKEPNEKDIRTIMRIFHWATHADKGMSVTIRYAFEWANMKLHEEYNRWTRK